MNITNLKTFPHLKDKTLSLIEKSLQYSEKNSFQIDFAPLVNEKNAANSYIVVENENVIAHIGLLEREIRIENRTFKIGLIGGIAVDPKKRGEGVFAKLFNHVLSESRYEISFFLLWSDLEKLYNKFGFYLCGEQYEIPQTNGNGLFTKTKYDLLSNDDQKRIQFLYQNSFCTQYLSLNRTEIEWGDISAIKSADLYIKKDSIITDYFFINKGQDLPGIIYEYGTENKLCDLFSEISHFGKIWLGSPLIESQEIQYQFFMAPGATQLFADFIHSYTKERISIREIKLMKQEVYFDFNSETLVLDTQDFLRGIFGPGIFEELGEMKSLFVSGLDSI